jgi:hypothetical protein
MMPTGRLFKMSETAMGADGSKGGEGAEAGFLEVIKNREKRGIPKWGSPNAFSAPEGGGKKAEFRGERPQIL